MKNLRSQALIYSRFCEFYGLQVFPADEWQMVRYARYIANTVISYDTVVNYISGVRTLHQLAGFEIVDLSSPNLRFMLRAIKRELAHPVKQAVPMTPQLLRELFNHVDLNDLRQIVSYTALLLGFYMFLRKSNLVPDTKGSFNHKEQLMRQDVRMGEHLVLVDIKWTKTLQFQQKELLLPLIPARDMAICPVYWLKLMLKYVKAKPTDPLFAVPTAQGAVPLTYDQLAKQLKIWVEMTGRSSDGYTLHGLRRGGASFALESGLVGEDIKIMGDWASLAYMTYLDQSVQRRILNMVKFMDNV